MDSTRGPSEVIFCDITWRGSCTLGNGAVVCASGSFQFLILLQEAKRETVPHHDTQQHPDLLHFSFVVYSIPEPHTIPQHVNFRLVSRDTKLLYFALCHL
jgi:hypothetical protein